MIGAEGHVRSASQYQEPLNIYQELALIAETSVPPLSTIAETSVTTKLPAELYNNAV